MGFWRYKKALFFSLLVGIVLFIFGQNFELVPKSAFLKPQSQHDNFLSFVRSPQSVTSEPGFFHKFIFRRPPILNSQDMQFEKAANKFLNSGVDNFLNDDEFRRSELGRAYQEIEKKTQVSLKVRSTYMGISSYEDDIEFTANQNNAYLKMKTQKISTKMNYSMQSQNMDLLFHRIENENQSFGLGYDRKSDTSQVKMQLNW